MGLSRPYVLFSLFSVSSLLWVKRYILTLISPFQQKTEQNNKFRCILKTEIKIVRQDQRWNTDGQRPYSAL